MGFLEKIPLKDKESELIKNVIGVEVEHWALRVGNAAKGEKVFVYEYEDAPLFATTKGARCNCDHRSGFGSPAQSLHMGTTTRSHEQIKAFCCKYAADHPKYSTLTCNCQHFIQELHAWLGCREKLPPDQLSSIAMTVCPGLKFMQGLVVSSFFSEAHYQDRQGSLTSA